MTFHAGVLHGTFSLAVALDALPSDVYAAVTRADLRRRWLRLPGRAVPADGGAGPDARPGAGSGAGPSAGPDYAVGVHETLRSVLTIGERDESVERSTVVHDVAADERVVFGYRAVVDDACRWVSLVTVQLERLAPSGTRLTWTEQFAFVVLTGDGDDDVAHLRGGTQLQLNGLAKALGTTALPV